VPIAACLLCVLTFSVRRVGWLNSHWFQIYERLKTVDEPLAAEMFGVLEGHPAVPFGLSGLGIEAMCLCRAVDSFRSILVAFVGEVFKAKPQTLLAASHEPVEVAEVLACGTLDEFRRRLAARKLRQLGGFSHRSAVHS
jgi:hypothetical protein